MTTPDRRKKLRAAADTVKDSEELEILYEMLRDRGQQFNEPASARLKIGDEVVFSHRESAMRGRITQIRKESVKVRSKSGTLWTLSPRLVHVVKQERRRAG